MGRLSTTECTYLPTYLSISLHSSSVIPSSVSDSSYMSAPCWTCVDECRSERSLACGVGFPTGLAFEALD